MSDGTRPQVLVIDDNTVVAETLAMVLNISGFQAHAVHSGEQGLKFAQENVIDHLITDVMMEGMNGIETAIAIRELLPNCRILLISGNNATAKLMAAASAEGHNFSILAKPVHPAELIEQMRSSSLKSIHASTPQA